MLSLRDRLKSDDGTEDHRDPMDDAPEESAGEPLNEAPEEVVAAAPANDLDSLADIVPERAMPSINDPAAPAAPAAETAPSAPAAVAAETEKSPEDDEEEIRRYAEANGIDHDQAREFLSRQAKVDFARQAGATPDEAQKAADSQAKALEQMMRQARGGGGGGAGGAVSALVGGVAGAVKGVAGMAGAGFRKARGHAATVKRDRLANHYHDVYESSLAEYAQAGDDIKRGVDEFNAAFLNTEAASRLRKMAGDAGQDLDSYLSDLNEGRNTDAAALAAAEAAASDGAVLKAADRIARGERRAEEAQDEISRMMGKFERVFPDRINPAEEAERLDDAAHGFNKGMKNPLYESKKRKAKGEAGPDSEETFEERQKRFAERMKDLADRIKEIIQRVMARFGLGPKP